ncbi:MAG TPA: metallophosphoesterase [Vicinamibacterales bacterium]|nr:metallophosphoesterase [Vicinamibacterales bacterium]
MKWLLAGSVLTLTGACGGGPSALPTSPTALSTGVVASVSPTPLTLRRGADGAAFQLSGDISFRNGGTDALRLVALDAEFADANGVSERQRLPLDLTLAAGQTVTRPLADTVVTRTVREPVRLTLIAQAMADGGQLFGIEPIGAPVVVATPATTVAPAAPVTFSGAGDIANCALEGAAETARLLDSIPGDLFTLGDHVYPSGTSEGFTTCYASTWGRHRFRTRPAPGNHEWEVNGGAPYFSYFGGAAGGGFYSFTLGAWHVLSLNSNVSAEPGSPQYEWARADLAASPSRCALAYWHHPLFSSGPNGNNGQMRSMWRLLDGAGVDVVMVGHDHLYERFAPQDADGRPTPAGMREFVAGTGGAQPYAAAAIQANSEARIERTWGVLRLTLRADAYDWEFVPVARQSARDAGSAACGI